MLCSLARPVKPRLDASWQAVLRSCWIPRRPPCPGFPVAQRPAKSRPRGSPGPHGASGKGQCYRSGAVSGCLRSACGSCTPRGRACLYWARPDGLPFNEIEYLGGQDHRVPAAASLCRPAPQNLLGVALFAAPAIDVRGVEEVIPSSTARSIILKLSSWVVCQPKFMVPRQMLLTRTPCLPNRLCSIAMFDDFFCLGFKKLVPANKETKPEF
jgi:hypothetical protein